MEKLSDAHFQTGKSIVRLCVKYAVRAEILSRSWTTGILDFATKGHVTSEPLSREEVFAMTAAAHDAGFL